MVLDLDYRSPPAARGDEEGASRADHNFLHSVCLNRTVRAREPGPTRIRLGILSPRRRKALLDPHPQHRADSGAEHHSGCLQLPAERVPHLLVDET